MHELYEEIIHENADRFGINPRLIAATIECESEWDVNKCEYQKNYTFLFEVDKMADLHDINVPTEIVLQRMKWGLMQVTGAVGLEHGLRLSACSLNNPHLNIYYGTKHLAKYAQMYTRLKDIYAGYNAGSVKIVNDRYVNEGAVCRFEKAYAKMGNLFPTV